jgi:hypothetical protein
MGCVLLVDVSWYYKSRELPLCIQTRVAIEERHDGVVFLCKDAPQTLSVRLDDGTITAAGSDADKFLRKVSILFTSSPFVLGPAPELVCYHAFAEKPSIVYEVAAPLRTNVFSVPVSLAEGRMMLLRLFADGLQVHTTRAFSIGKLWFSCAVLHVRFTRASGVDYFISRSLRLLWKHV